MDADDLRLGLRSILSGGSGSSKVDPFSERNEYEDERRKRAGRPGRRARSGRAEAQEPTRSAGPRAGPRKSQTAADDALDGRSDPDAEEPPQSARGGKGGGGGGKGSGGRQGQRQGRWRRRQGSDSEAPSEPAAATASVEPASHTRLPLVSGAWWRGLAPPAPSARPPATAELEELKARAAALYEAELGAFSIAQKHKHGKDASFVQRLSASGTAKDRIAAMTLQAQESAFHCLPHVRQLLFLAERPAVDLKLGAIEALTELFLTRLLPPDVSLQPPSATPPRAPRRPPRAASPARRRGRRHRETRRRGHGACGLGSVGVGGGADAGALRVGAQGALRPPRVHHRPRHALDDPVHQAADDRARVAMLCERTLTRTLTLTLILTLSQARVGDAERAAGA